MNALHKPTPRKEGPLNSHNGGFTLVGLLVIIGVTALLAVMWLPALARSKSQAQEARCLNNLRQLMQAAHLYADDNCGIWFPNQPGQDGWVTDNMTWNDGGLPYTSTNVQCVLAPYGSTFYRDFGICSFFAPYLKDPAVYKCPADPSTADGGAPRVRSYSANAAVGTCFANVGERCGHAGGAVTGQWLSGILTDCQDYGNVYPKLSQMNRPNPVNLWVFAEEHPDSINDSELQVQIAHVGKGGYYIDQPSNLHNGAAPFSFADGHAFVHQWVGPILGQAPFFQNGTGNSWPTTTATSTVDVADLTWLQSHTSSPINPSIAFPTPQN